MDKVIMDSRLKTKIEELTKWGNGCCSISFKDLEGTFWFEDSLKLQEFIREQEVERFYDKQLRKGYFDYQNEHGEVIRYYIESCRGTLKVNSEIVLPS